MLKPQHDPWHRKNFVLGANSDVDRNMLPPGIYTDAFNMRPASVDGNSGAIKRIGGEVLRYSNANMLGADTYVCLGSVSVKGHVVTFWASTDGNAYPPFIEVDGVISAMSFGIPYRFDRPHQYAEVVECKKAGVIYVADHASPHLYWDVQSLIDNQGTQFYFSAFNINTVTVGLNTPPIIIWLNEQEPLVDRSGLIGLNTGQYSYSARLKAPTGDATNWGPETNLFNVPAKYTPEVIVNGQSSNYPGGRSFGGPTDPQVPTSYGLNMEMRIDNAFGYSYVEIKRRRFNDGAGLTGAGVEEIIARIPIVPGQLNIIPFCDNIDSNIVPEVVAPNEADNILVNPTKAKSVEYANSRLTYFNFEVEPQPTGMVFRTVDGRLATSITKKLVRNVGGIDVPDTYANPFIHGNYSSYQRGEVNGFGYQMLDSSQGRWFATDIPGLENYQHPNRRDIKGANGAWGADSAIYSDDPIWAANVDLSGVTLEGPVGQTFEVMTQGLGAKSDCETVLNVAAQNGSTPGDSVGRSSAAFFAFGSSLPNGLENTGGFVRPDTTAGSYRPWDPRNNAAGASGYNIPPNVARLVAPVAAPPSDTNLLNQNFISNVEDARGRIFGPTYQALGTLLYGMDNIPKSVSCFGVVRTERAGRVIMQGMGSPVLIPNDQVPANKSTTALNVFFPEAEAGSVSQAELDNLAQNPGDYDVQIVAGFGEYTEINGYSGEDVIVNPPFFPGIPFRCAHLMDIMMYARIMEDHGQVNVGEPPAGVMGQQPISGSPAPPGNYVSQDQWRRIGTMQGTDASPGAQDYSFMRQPGNDGNSYFSLTGFAPQSTERGTSFYRLTFNQYVYSPGTDTVGLETLFDSPTVRNFHQPYYVVNIIRRNAQVPASNSTPYKPTGCWVGMNTRIGIYSSQQNSFRLLGQREWMDCVNYLGDEYRYVYVQPPNGPEQRWLCVTGNTVISVPVILLSITSIGFWIAPDGGRVYGLYDRVFNNGQQFLVFGNYFAGPPEGSSIYVRYDSTAPLRVFGGDTTIAQQVHAIHDVQATRNDIDNNNPTGELNIYGLPLPYAGFLMNPRYFMPEKSNQTEEQIFMNFCRSIRQWCIMWDVETRIAPAMYVNLNSTTDTLNSASQMFPFVHYVMRPYTDVETSGPQPGFYAAYNADYPLEYTISRFGGFRFQPAINFDYAKDELVDFKGFPKAGLVYRTDYCTFFIASQMFEPNQVDNPGLRTFLNSGLKNVSEETGEGKVCHSLTDGTIGQNMYFWTQRGWGYVLTNKRLLYGVSGEIVGTQPIDNYWGDVVFLSREHGMPDELWRLHGKGPAKLGKQLVDSVFWADREGAYRAYGTTFVPIADDKFLTRLLPALQAIGTGFDDNITGVFDTTKQEWLLAMNPSAPATDPQNPFVYSAKRDEWGGTYGHRFDKYVVSDGKLLGMRANVQTFNLDDPNSTTQNNAPIVAFAETAFAPEPGIRFEAVRFRAHPSKPFRVEIYDNQHNLVFFTDQATQEALTPGTGPLYVMRVDGWEADVGRSNPGLNPLPESARPRVQDELFYLRMIYDAAERGILTDAQLQLQKLI